MGDLFGGMMGGELGGYAKDDGLYDY
jgi:hypothetical protein